MALKAFVVVPNVGGLDYSPEDDRGDLSLGYLAFVVNGSGQVQPFSVEEPVQHSERIWITAMTTADSLRALITAQVRAAASNPALLVEFLFDSKGLT